MLKDICSLSSQLSSPQDQLKMAWHNDYKKIENKIKNCFNKFISDVALSNHTSVNRGELILKTFYVALIDDEADSRLKDLRIKFLNYFLPFNSENAYISCSCLLPKISLKWVCLSDEKDIQFFSELVKNAEKPEQVVKSISEFLSNVKSNLKAYDTEGDLDKSLNKLAWRHLWELIDTIINDYEDLNIASFAQLVAWLPHNKRDEPQIFCKVGFILTILEELDKTTYFFSLINEIEEDLRAEIFEELYSDWSRKKEQLKNLKTGIPFEYFRPEYASWLASLEKMQRTPRALQSLKEKVILSYIPLDFLYIPKDATEAEICALPLDQMASFWMKFHFYSYTEKPNENYLAQKNLFLNVMRAFWLIPRAEWVAVASNTVKEDVAICSLPYMLWYLSKLSSEDRADRKVIDALYELSQLNCSLEFFFTICTDKQGETIKQGVNLADNFPDSPVEYSLYAAHFSKDFTTLKIPNELNNKQKCCYVFLKSLIPKVKEGDLINLMCEKNSNQVCITKKLLNLLCNIPIESRQFQLADLCVKACPVENNIIYFIPPKEYERVLNWIQGWNGEGDLWQELLNCIGRQKVLSHCEEAISKNFRSDEFSKLYMTVNGVNVTHFNLCKFVSRNPSLLRIISKIQFTDEQQNAQFNDIFNDVENITYLNAMRSITGLTSFSEKALREELKNQWESWTGDAKFAAEIIDKIKSEELGWTLGAWILALKNIDRAIDTKTMSERKEYLTAILQCQRIKKELHRNQLYHAVDELFMYGEGLDQFLLWRQKNKKMSLFIPQLLLAHACHICEISKSDADAIVNKIAKLLLEMKDPKLKEAFFNFIIKFSNPKEMSSNDISAVWKRAFDSISIEEKIILPEQPALLYTPRLIDKTCPKSEKLPPFIFSEWPSISKTHFVGTVENKLKKTTSKAWPCLLGRNQRQQFETEEDFFIKPLKNPSIKTNDKATLVQITKDLRLLTFIGQLTCLTEENISTNGKDLEAWLQNLIIEKAKVKPRKDFGERFFQIFFKMRRPESIFEYMATIANVPLASQALGRFIDAVIDGNFAESRLDESKSEHLKLIFGKFPLLKKIWAEGSSRNIKVATQLQETDIITIFKESLKHNHFSNKNLTEFERFLNNENDREEIRASINEKISSSNCPKLKAQLLLMDLLLNKDLKAEEKISLLDQVLAYLKLLKNDPFHADLMMIKDSLMRKQSCTEYLLVDSDDPTDLFLCGTEVSGSCQRVDGNPDLNKGLLGYILDGKIRLLALKDKDTGAIVCRSLLRLLWDPSNEVPVLFLVRIYPETASEECERAILDLAKAKASAMDLSLISAYVEIGNSCEGEKYVSLIGPSPYEYVDELRGVVNNGVYEIDDNKINDLNLYKL